MRKKANRKNLIITILVILLLALGVGYAAFSDTLTISGTANAKGTFDLEFQNAEVVKNVGADAEKTTAVISEDKNTLTVNAADLSYPGAGVEFAVDIVNVGSIPAEVQSVTPTNITGSDKIKVTGLEEIKVGHPKIEVGDRCNIHFTVEWPADSGEIPEAESSISFGLQIEYTQSTGEVFDGKASHTDFDKTGAGITDSILKEGFLREIISEKDYGKTINYTANVNGQTLSNWKVLYNDETNVYIILENFLPIELVPEATGLTTTSTYDVHSSTTRDVFINAIRTESYWTEFANGMRGSTATGTPTLEMLINSYNEKHKTNMDILTNNSASTRILDNNDSLYIPYKSGISNCFGYWLASPNSDSDDNLWYADSTGSITTISHVSQSIGIRPVVCLPTNAAGMVTTTVEIVDNGLLQ